MLQADMPAADSVTHIGTHAAIRPAPTFLPQAAQRLPGALRGPLLSLLGLNRLAVLYDSLPRHEAPAHFAGLALEALGVSLQMEGAGREGIPASGPLVVVANHPFGALEGLLLAHALLPVRPDLRFLANYMLSAVPEMRGLCISVDPFGGKDAARRNVAALREAMRHVEAGGALAVFPSGTVSHLQPSRRAITDPAWHPNVGRLVHRTGADALPVHFHGRNSLFFNLAGLLHPAARTALLPKELLKKRDSVVTCTVGRVIPSATMRDLPGDEERTRHLRMRCYGLAPAPRKVLPLFPRPRPRSVEPVATPRAPSLIRDAVHALCESPAFLLSEGGYSLLETDAAAAPDLLHEIGRLREETFRAVGEGSGKALDLDPFDATYRHLILWHEGDGRIAGAYRFGEVDRILAAQGVKGLYSSTLFRFRPGFFALPGSALELGRAFVHADYQRDYAPLLLLWKGLARCVLRRPGVRRMFGPVSVSLGYSPYSLQAIIDWMLRHSRCPVCSPLVKGRVAPRLRQPGATTPPRTEGLDYNGLCSLVRDMEGGPGVPILFKHYLRLGGRIATFHCDRAFGSLDAFLSIDLASTPRRMLARYMGEEGLASFEASKQRADAAARRTG
ncbi:lysophospholipid acyltransferase family protein [Nitratidesulfovibrio vulgaris]|uniref:Phospholipid/glycerol acyltransferase n=1 Tax=Nitratidesulfovibrio vulgaris (strain DP4) TaxID=391774 RepID=A0A0H3AC82_NITV4|nr:GNAT family N-acyltransferase [Nitratidesulfovibrio vulgaris]ABM29934.1 phospholipid/glycerol acyltransferase [Nitratidesulfovibrio vulgaris DP4]GEB81398.1 acyltransferase [Desulfovibrio desulfuricans]